MNSHSDKRKLDIASWWRCGGDSEFNRGLAAHIGERQNSDAFVWTRTGNCNIGHHLIWEQYANLMKKWSSLGFEAKQHTFIVVDKARRDL